MKASDIQAKSLTATITIARDAAPPTSFLLLNSLFTTTYGYYHVAHKLTIATMENMCRALFWLNSFRLTNLLDAHL